MAQDTEKMNIREFVDYKVEALIQYVEDRGRTRVSTCDYRGWCKQTWNSINLISNKMREKGYGVSMQVNHQVQDWDFYLIN